MSSYLTPKDGLYDPTKRFAFKNITKEPFTFQWGGKPITVKEDMEIEVPHHLAVLATGKLVDQIMNAEIIAEEKKAKEKNNNPYYRSAKGTSLGVPEARKVWEDKILRQLAAEEESPQMAVIRAQIREELTSDLSREKAQKVDRISVKPEEFSEVKSKR